jgi:phosphatidate cytidylyltransferase
MDAIDIKLWLSMATIPGEQATQSAGKPASNLTQRIITALVVLPFVLAAAVIGGLPFTILAGSLGCIGVAEFYLLAQKREVQGSTFIGVPTSAAVMLAFHLQQNSVWLAALGIGAILTFALETIRHPNDLRRSLTQVVMTLAGVLYVGIPTGLLIQLRAQPDGLVWLLLVFALTWGTDSFAYVGGRLWGKTKLAAHISPKKTLEGALVGIIGGIVSGLLILVVSGKLAPALFVLVVLGPFVAILGDLVESALKRFFDVKDSHIVGLNILPGHGGVLDRVDALILVAIFASIYLHVVVLP